MLCYEIIVLYQVLQMFKAEALQINYEHRAGHLGHGLQGDHLQQAEGCCVKMLN